MNHLLRAALIVALASPLAAPAQQADAPIATRQQRHLDADPGPIRFSDGRPGYNTVREIMVGQRAVMSSTMSTTKP